MCGCVTIAFCESCGDTWSSMRFLRLCDFALEVRPRSTRTDGNEVVIEWEPDGHVSRYPAKWLRRHVYSDRARELRRHHPIVWDAKIVEQHQWFDLQTLRDAYNHSELLQTVRDYGVAWVRGVTPSKDGVVELASLVGRVAETGSAYESVFELSPSASRRVIGTSRYSVPPHTDEAYMHQPLGVNFLLCVEPSEDGEGASVLVDGFRVAEELRATDPDAFALLCRVPLPYHRYHEGEMDVRSEAPCSASIWMGS